MPGILPRPEGIPKGSAGTKMASDAQSSALAVEDVDEPRMEDYRNGNTLTNGDHEPVNGNYANGISKNPMEVQRKVSSAIENLVGQLPPEIEHITFGYTPFSTLVSRLVQETFNGLADVINDMSEMSVPQSGQNAPLNHFNQQINGNGDTLGANIQKKLRILNFTSDRRAQFIKVLILLRWARQAEAVSKIIDLNVWTNRRLQEYKDCISWMGELKRILVSLRDPNPDIKTALEVLSLGKASWLPDLSYLPPEPLSPQQLLNTLRKINTLLSIRLNLHEAIPPVFRDYSILSGRATFRVPDEFEVDVSIAEEDPESQLYFVDFRFAFSPTPAELPAGRLRDELEGRANDILKREGLQGLFDFLHNLVLTHKLSVLRNQAYELARGYWSEQLKVEAVHRLVVVQYWLSRAGGKNWIEIGLKSGKETRISYSSSSQRIPHVALRWFRGGKEVPNVRVMLKLGELSLSEILRQVIALHTSYTFQQMAAKLAESLLYSGSSLRLKCNSSATEPMDASLLVQITTSKAIKVVQEPVSGRFSILPPSQLNSRVEHELNRLASPASEGASQLAHLRSLASHEEVATGVRFIGWEPLRSLNPSQETVQKLFSKSIQRTKFFRRPTWSSSWLMAFTTSLEGDCWWIVELTDKAGMADMTTTNSNAGPILRAAYRIVLLGPKLLVLEPSYKALAEIERTAAGMINQYADTCALRDMNLHHKIQLSKPKNTGGTLGSLFIRFPSTRGPAIVRSRTALTVPWLGEIVRLDYRDLDPSKSFTIHQACAQMRQSISELQDMLSSIPSIDFQPANEEEPETVKFRFLAKVGETVVPNLDRRLVALERLLDFASIIKSHHFTFNAASLSHLSFSYTRSLKAAIHFPEDAPMHVSLTKPNPHLRIVDHLTNQLRSKSLSPVIGIFRITLSLLRTFSAIEAAQNSAGVNILTRSDQWYQVRYSDPYSRGGFDIRLRHRRDNPMWFIAESTMKRPNTADEAFEDCLKAVMRGKGDGWWGVRGGMIAHIKGVENLVARLDEVFRTVKHVAAESNPRKRKAEEVVEID